MNLAQFCKSFRCQPNRLNAICLIWRYYFSNSWYRFEWWRCNEIGTTPCSSASTIFSSCSCPSSTSRTQFARCCINVPTNFSNEYSDSNLHINLFCSISQMGVRYVFCLINRTHFRCIFQNRRHNSRIRCSGLWAISTLNSFIWKLDWQYAELSHAAPTSPLHSSSTSFQTLSVHIRRWSHYSLSCNFQWQASQQPQILHLIRHFERILWKIWMNDPLFSCWRPPQNLRSWGLIGAMCSFRGLLSGLFAVWSHY